MSLNCSLSNEMVNTNSDVATVVILPTTNLQFAEVSVVPSGCYFQHSLCCETLLTSGLKGNKFPLKKKSFLLFTFTAVFYSLGLFSLERSSFAQYLFPYKLRMFSRQDKSKSQVTVMVRNEKVMSTFGVNLKKHYLCCTLDRIVGFVQ